MKTVTVGGTYWTIVPYDTEDFGFDPVPPYEVVVDGPSGYGQHGLACHVKREHDPARPLRVDIYVGCQIEDLHEARADAWKAYREAILKLADELESRAKGLREEAAGIV